MSNQKQSLIRTIISSFKWSNTVRKRDIIVDSSCGCSDKQPERDEESDEDEHETTIEPIKNVQLIDFMHKLILNLGINTAHDYDGIESNSDVEIYMDAITRRVNALKTNKQTNKEKTNYLSECKCSHCVLHNKAKWATVNECQCTCHNDIQGFVDHSGMCCSLPNVIKSNNPHESLESASHYNEQLQKELND